MRNYIFASGRIANQRQPRINHAENAAFVIVNSAGKSAAGVEKNFLYSENAKIKRQFTGTRKYFLPGLKAKREARKLIFNATYESVVEVMKH